MTDDTPDIGHNSGIAVDRLRSFVTRIESLEQDKAETAEDIRDVYTEAKSQGFDTKILRQVIRLRQQDDATRREQDETRDLYMAALGDR